MRSRSWILKEVCDMHLSITLNPFVDSDLLYAQQLGVTWVVGNLPAWDYETLAAACNRVAKSGLYLSGLSCLPEHLLTKALLDKSKSVMAVNEVCQIITNAGKLGISTLGYSLPFAPPAGIAKTITGRGGAMSAVYGNHDCEKPALQDSREEMWQALMDFLQCVMPVAEATGVRLAYRTDISAASQPEDRSILDSVPELDRLFQVAGSSSHGLDLDHGFLTAILIHKTDSKVEEVIQHFGLQNRIFAVRLRNLRRVDHGVQEFFLDEDRVDMIRTLQAYKKSGFEGSLCPIPSPG
ncbi:MAG: hypothetical protein E4H27_01005, partial [Anaerolineales bacterium]